LTWSSHQQTPNNIERSNKNQEQTGKDTGEETTLKERPNKEANAQTGTCKM
jgi:hypothetical protein